MDSLANQELGCRSGFIGGCASVTLDRGEGKQRQVEEDRQWEGGGGRLAVEFQIIGSRKREEGGKVSQKKRERGDYETLGKE